MKRFAPGMRIGDYRIERELATEETGVVYLGLHAVLPRQASVKVMHAAVDPARALAAQVLPEARLLEALSHPGIPRVFECGLLHDRLPWAAFERITGASLASLIECGPMAPAEVIVVLRDVGDLLAHAHARGVVHRRLTADAIVRTADRGSSVCVRRWDDARALDDEAGGAGDAREDVRALGAVMFHALAGAAPDRHAPAPAGERCPGAPAELAALIDQMLAADPASRPPSDEVRDRTRWLSDTVEPRMSDRLRWASAPESSPRRGPGGPVGAAARIGRVKP